LRSDSDCGDALQNAVFAAWRKLPSLREEAQFEPWLMRILLNACRDVQRGYLRRKGELPMEEALHAASAPPRDVDLQIALQTLPEKFRLPILLHHMNGLSVPVIARVLRLPQSTVKGRIREGLKKLRRLLEEEEG
ncbi:MAG: sigma-70 family RNA polymerase sigma factor, partial [Clostridia bacterium]|nr:sigma-70 family RNA polymerase sigma factor [Clostridia bacterium]